MAYKNVNECGIGSFVFYESFFKHLGELPEKQAKDFLWYIVEYGLYGKEPELTGFEKLAWEQIKIAITNSNARYIASVINGSKGGAPEGNDNAKKGKTCRKCKHRKSCASRIENGDIADTCNDFELSTSQLNPKQPSLTQDNRYYDSYYDSYSDSEHISLSESLDEIGDQFFS